MQTNKQTKTKGIDMNSTDLSLKKRYSKFPIEYYKNKIEIVAQSDKDQFTKNALIALQIFRISIVLTETESESSAVYKKLFQEYKESGHIKDVRKKE